ncbi:hypothetical protein LTR36_002272 [Oleoguttula mirabilis]|uniref:HypA n=1 Tax=Oleoguttula mirabilis TaxID=1507867 RepID=A0AAV9JM96_9PEZI|nr:hypothetical protein LTR36_002272 [Oleoguttula mirabilis]
MATSNKILLTLGEWPVYYRPGILQESANTASELLQKNHDSHHIFFNKGGFHNHEAHHLLTLWALRAEPGELRKAYNINEGYQRPLGPLNESILAEMHDPDKFSNSLGNEKYYHEFLLLFQKEIATSSWQEVVDKYLFAGDESADDMLARTLAGFLHPLIHLGFGIEFHQPAIIAEAMAQSAVHDNYMRRLFIPAEKAAKNRGCEESKTIVELLDAIHHNTELRNAPRWSDGNKLRDGIMGRAGDRMIEYASQFRVKPDELERKTAEMTNAAAYYTAGAQRADKMIKYDFYYMHCVNCSIFFSAFLKQDWLSDANKVRLLEWKVRNDLAMYASRKSPDIRIDDIRDYRPKQPSGWDEIEDRVCRLDDDGHASKLVRALAHGERICQPYDDREEFRIKHDDWLQMGHMAIDSVEEPSANWVRSAGFDEAWENVPARPQL